MEMECIENSHKEKLMATGCRYQSYLSILKSQKADVMKVIYSSPTQKQIIRELKRTLKSFARDLENGMACSEEEERDLVKKIGSNANRSLRLNYKYKKIAKQLDDEIEKCEIFISNYISKLRSDRVYVVGKTTLVINFLGPLKSLFWKNQKFSNNCARNW